MQVALGLALIALAFVQADWAFPLLWPGASVLMVGIAYLGIGPRVFGKSLDGRLNGLHVFALWPYFLVAWGLWQVKSRFLGENAHDEVAPGIIVGRRPLGAAEVPAHATVVVDLTSEFRRAPSTQRIERYECLPTLDTAAPDLEAMRTLLDRIEGETGPVYVHCAMGHGRSATVAAALMIRRGLAEDVDEAVSQMIEARPKVRLHAGQRAAVTELSRSA